MSDFSILFKQITGNSPYEYQIEIYRALAEGQSVILRAPTGSGKSEAVYIPYLLLKGKAIPPRLIYSLPMRALVNSLHERFKGYTPDLDVRVQHGKRRENLFFDADCVVATLDQVITSYACAPLSLGVRFGNIPAGGVAGSFLVFDEVHTFDPGLGLQSCLILAKRMTNIKIPFVIMTATLPSGFMSFLANELKAKIIDAKEETIPARMKRKVTINYCDHLMTPEGILSLIEEFSGRIIIACNTVSRAIEIYKNLKGKADSETILIHSRFFDDDRARIENKINTLFGKNSHGKAILIATQVIEVGMDISCDLLLSELAPIDSLIQRAGRCARWGGEGNVIVFNAEHHVPYDKELIDLTRDALRKFEGTKLSWSNEKQMVDEVLENRFNKVTSFEAMSKPMMYLSEAAFKGRSDIAEKAVRDSFFVEVSIHDNPKLLGDNIIFLPRCRIHTGTFKKFVKENKPEAWLIEFDRDVDDDYKPKIEHIPLKSEKDVKSNKFYVLHCNSASYNPEEGLVLGESGNPLEISQEEKDYSEEEKESIPLETWQEHSFRVLRIFEDKIYPAEEYIYLKLSAYLGISMDKIKELLRFILLLHDLGKLNESWQKAIGNNKVYLAHSGDSSIRELPPHATISAYVLGDYLREKWGKILGDAAFFAIAHHHSVRATMVPKYELSEGWYDEVKKVLGQSSAPELPWEFVKNFESQSSPTTLSWQIPPFEKEKIYTTYLIFSRSLRLSDQQAVLDLIQDRNSIPIR